MGPGRWVSFILAVSILLIFSEGYAAPVLFNQALKGRVFGSPSSNDVPKRIVVGSDGSIYIAGHTTPGKANDAAWGYAEAGEATGRKDVFLAKFSPAGQLLWVKRTGSSENDTVSDLKIAKNALYLCGSTYGKLGIPSQGSSDAFIMKFSLNGVKSWRHPFQFGSRGYDACHSMHIDPLFHAIYVTGNTNGRMFGTVAPNSTALHYFVAVFEELQNDPVGLKLVKGRQQGSLGSCTGDGVVAAGNVLYVMSSNWDENWDKKKTVTYLNILEPGSLKLKKLHVLNAQNGTGFHGIRMEAVNETGDVYAIGIASKKHDFHEYYTIKYSPSANSGEGGVEWARRVGEVNPRSRMKHQIPSIAADPWNKMVYVAGVEDGFYVSTIDRKSAIVSVPFLKINMSNGNVHETWHRTTRVPFETEELADIALDPGKAVVYTGVWDGGPELHSNALVGSFGSPGHSSRTSGSKPVATAAFAQAEDNEVEQDGMSRAKMIGYILLGLGAIGFALTALFVYNSRSSRRAVKLDDDEISYASKMEDIRRQAAESHRETGFSQTEAIDVVIGGSANPQ